MTCLLLTGPALGACTGSADGADGTTTTPTPSADELAWSHAVRDARALLTRAGALAATTDDDPELVRVLTRIARNHGEHLAALGAPVPTTTATPAPAGTPPTRAAADDRLGLRRLVAAERAAARTALTDVTTASPDPAAVLARIAAARAVHADLLARAGGIEVPGRLPDPARTTVSSPGTGVTSTAPPATTPDTDPGATGQPHTPTPLAEPARRALVERLRGEHAAVFAYGVVVARIGADRRDEARTLWTAHVRTRDTLSRELTAAGITPPVAAAAYDLGGTPSSRAEAERLAARVESGLAALAAGAVRTTTGPYRTASARALVEAARRAARWEPAAPALPGAAVPGVQAPTTSTSRDTAASTGTSSRSPL
jgi:hypothetical protein